MLLKEEWIKINIVDLLNLEIIYSCNERLQGLYAISHSLMMTMYLMVLLSLRPLSPITFIPYRLSNSLPWHHSPSFH